MSPTTRLTLTTQFKLRKMQCQKPTNADQAMRDLSNYSVVFPHDLNKKICAYRKTQKSWSMPFNVQGSLIINLTWNTNANVTCHGCIVCIVYQESYIDHITFSINSQCSIDVKWEWKNASKKGNKKFCQLRHHKNYGILTHPYAKSDFTWLCIVEIFKVH